MQPCVCASARRLSIPQLLNTLNSLGATLTYWLRYCTVQVAKLEKELNAERKRNKEESDRDRLRLEELASSRPKADGGAKRALTGSRQKIREAKDALAKAQAESQVRTSF